MAVAVGVRAAPAPGLEWAWFLDEQSGSDSGRGGERGGGGEHEKENYSSQQPTGFGQRREGSWELWFHGRAAEPRRLSACPALAGL